MRKNFSLSVDSDEFPNLPREDMIEANQFAALKLALKTDKPYVLYIDSDRLSLALNYYPEESVERFNGALRKANESSKVISFARSPRAINTHISSLVLTENIIHHFYNRHLNIGQEFVDVAAAAYFVRSEDLRKSVEQYKGGKFLRVRCNFPQPKILLDIVNRTGRGLDSIMTDNMLRYEAPEQMRNDGRIVFDRHEWTPECYEEVTLRSRSVQEEIMQNPAEWKSRFTNVAQYLKILDRLWLNPRGKSDNGLTEAVLEVNRILDDEGIAVDDYRENAARLFWKYN